MGDDRHRVKLGPLLKEALASSGGRACADVSVTAAEWVKVVQYNSLSKDIARCVIARSQWAISIHFSRFIAGYEHGPI